MTYSKPNNNKKLTKKDIDFYQNNGYLVIENVLNNNEVKELQNASLTLEEERNKLGGNDKLAVIMNVVFLHEAFMKTAFNKIMLGVAQQLIGENLRLQHCKLNWKPKSVGAGEVKWHQDFPYFPHTNHDLLACMFLLDDASIQNGCMRMIPGSHKYGPIDHKDANGKFTGNATDNNPYEEDLKKGNIADLEFKKGTMTIHHCCTLHASYPNITDTPRRGLVYQIAGGNNIQLGGNLHKARSIWLTGNDPEEVKFMDGTTLPLPRELTNVGGLEPSANWKTITEE